MCQLILAVAVIAAAVYFARKSKTVDFLRTVVASKLGNRRQEP